MAAKSVAEENRRLNGAVNHLTGLGLAGLYQPGYGLCKRISICRNKAENACAARLTACPGLQLTKWPASRRSWLAYNAGSKPRSGWLARGINGGGIREA